MFLRLAAGVLNTIYTQIQIATIILFIQGIAKLFVQNLHNNRKYQNTPFFINNKSLKMLCF